eukprot:2642793-Amphidinium_carterae.1
MMIVIMIVMVVIIVVLMTGMKAIAYWTNVILSSLGKVGSELRIIKVVSELISPTGQPHDNDSARSRPRNHEMERCGIYLY